MMKKRFPARLLLFIILLLPTVCFASANELPEPVKNILNLFQNKDFAQAELALNQYLTENPKSPHRAMLWMTAGRANGSTIKCVPYFRKITETFPDSPLAPLAQIELAQMQFICGSASTAAAEAKRFLEKWPSHEKKMDALLLLAAIDSQSGRIRSAANRYAEAAVRCSDSPRVAEAFVGLGDCKFRMEDFAGAKDAYYKALEKGTAALDVGKIYYQLGMIAKKKSRPEEARRYFMLLTKHYPKSRYSKRANEALQALGERTDERGGDQLLAPLALPKAAFTVKTASYPSREKAEQLAKRLANAGHEVDIQEQKGLFQVRVGRFTSEMDAFFFAEQLQNKFGLKTEIISMGQ